MATDTATLSAAAHRDPTQHLWQLPVLLLGVAVFVVAWRGPTIIGPSDPSTQFRRDLAALQAAHERATPDATDLKNLLNKVAAGVEACPEQAPQGQYQLGSGYVRLAEITPAIDEAHGYWALALQHFERVSEKQLRDPADRSRLVFRTAKARVAVGLPENVSTEDIHRLLTILTAPQAEEPGETQRLVAELALRFRTPDLARARMALTQYLTATGSATPTASLARGRLLLGTLYLQPPVDNDQARKWLGEIGSDAPPDVQAQGNAALAKVLMAEGDWRGAAKRLEFLRRAPGVPPAIRQGATYQLAMCKLKQHEPPGEVAKLLAEVASTKSDGPEARAAAIQLARIKLESKEPADHRAAASLLAGAVKDVTSSTYDGQFVRLDETQAIFEQVVATLLSDGEYEAAIGAAEKYAAIAPPGRDRERRAEVLGAWAEAMLKEKKNTEAKARFKAAADEFAALAAFQPKPEGKAEMLRHAAELAKKAGDPAVAAERLTEALKLKDLPEPLLQTVLFDLADAKLAIGHPEEVLKLYNQIMAPNNSLATAARYRLARAFVDSRHAGLVPVGRALFEQIADQKSVAPGEQQYHERSLTELANSLIREGNFAEAEARLRKQLGLYQNGPEAPLAKLLLGVCLLQRASAPLPAEETTKMRAEALANFKRIITTCDAAERRNGKLTEREAWLRLQASLRVLQTHQQMRKPLDLLSDAAPLLDRYKNTVEELIILSLVYHAFKQLNDPGKALDTRARMKETFDKLAPSAFPQKDGEYSREYWQKVWFPPEKP